MKFLDVPEKCDRLWNFPSQPKNVIEIMKLLTVSPTGFSVGDNRVSFLTFSSHSPTESHLLFLRNFNFKFLMMSQSWAYKKRDHTQQTSETASSLYATMDNDHEMTEVFEEEPQAMDISFGAPMEQPQEIIISALGKQVYKPVLATLSDEMTKNISAVINVQLEVMFPSIIDKVMDAIVFAINAKLIERFGSATRPKQPEVMEHLIGMMGQKMMGRVINSLRWQCNMQRQVMGEVIPAILEEIIGSLVQQMMQLVRPTVDQVMNNY